MIVACQQTFHDKPDLLPQIAALGTRPLATSKDLWNFTYAITIIGILDNILKFSNPFQPEQDLVNQVLRTAQTCLFYKMVAVGYNSCDSAKPMRVPFEDFSCS